MVLLYDRFNGSTGPNSFIFNRLLVAPWLAAAGHASRYAYYWAGAAASLGYKRRWLARGHSFGLVDMPMQASATSGQDGRRRLGGVPVHSLRRGGWRAVGAAEAGWGGDERKGGRVAKLSQGYMPSVANCTNICLICASVGGFGINQSTVSE